MLHRHERYNSPGTVHFVTTVTSVRGRWFVPPELCEEILRAFEKYRTVARLHCLGYVLMPDHFHALLLQTEDSAPVSRLMNNFKGFTSRFVKVSGYPEESLWRADYDDVRVPGPDAIRTKLHYTHFNPVRKKLVECPEDYAWSSAAFLLLGKSSLITLSEVDFRGVLLTDPTASRP